MIDKIYRLIDIAHHIDRDKSIIVEWEERGLIPYAKRDSRGLRYYTKGEMQYIMNLVKETSYFKKLDQLPSTMRKDRGVSSRALYIGVLLAVILILSQLAIFG